MTMKGFITTLLLILCTIVRAQTADALYDEGKKLYDQKKYELAIKKLLPAAQKDRKSTRLNSSHNVASRMPSSA